MRFSAFLRPHVSIGLVACSAALLFLQCGKTKVDEPQNEEPTPDPYEPDYSRCPQTPTVPGTWTELLQPYEVMGGAGDIGSDRIFSDGLTLSVADNGHLAVLREGELDWEVKKTGHHLAQGQVLTAASPRFLFTVGSRNVAPSGAYSRYEGVIEVLDTETVEWKHIEREDPSTGFAALVWTGKEFLAWRHIERTADDWMIMRMDGLLFDPSIGQQNIMPSAAANIHYNPYNDEGEVVYSAAGEITATWTERGLYVWGRLPLQDRPFSALYSAEDEMWHDLNIEGGPGIRRHHQLIEGDDEVFVVGGSEINTDNRNSPVHYIDDIWRYSFANDSWEEVELPEGLESRSAAWLDGKLYVFTQCFHNSVYDPHSETWGVLPLLDVEGGIPYVAGGRIIMAQIREHHIPWSPYVYVFDPNGDAQMNVGGQGGGGN